MAQPEPPPLARLLQLIRLERADLQGLAVYAAGVGLLTLTVPIGVQALVNTVAVGALVQPVVILAALVTLGLGLAAALTAVQTVIVELISRRIFVRTACRFADRLLRASDDGLRGRDPVELTNRFFDVVTVEKQVGIIVLDGLTSVLQIGVGLALLAVYHPVMLAFDIGLVLFASLAIALGFGAVKSALKESTAKYALVAFLEELARSREAFAGETAQAQGRSRAESFVGLWLSEREAHFSIVLRQLVVLLLLQLFATVAVLGLGGWLVIRGELSLGQLVAAELVMTATVASLAKLGRLFPKAYDLLAALEKLSHVEDLPVDDAPGRPPPPSGNAPWRMDLRELVIDEGSAPFTAVVPPGACRFLPREARTQRLFDVLDGRSRQVGGVVLYQGVDVRELARFPLRDRVLRVSRPHIVTGTVADNMLLVKPDAAPEQMWAALENVGLASRILALPEGLHTPLSQRGPLDRAERLQLTFARAQLAAPAVLLVDSVLDELTGDAAQAVRRMLLEEEAPWTRLVATANPAFTTTRRLEWPRTAVGRVA